MNFNKVILAGNLTDEPEMRKTPSGDPVCSFTIATNRYWTDQDSGEKEQKTEYHDVVAWRRLAEIASQYLDKGSLVLIEGRLQTRSWEDSNDNTRSKTEVVARKMQMGPRATKGENPGMAQQQPSPKQEKDDEDIPVIEEDQPEPDSNDSEEGSDEEGEVDVEDIPF